MNLGVSLLTLSVTWVPVAADFARHSRSSRAAFTAVVGGYTVAQVACLALGVIAIALVGSDQLKQSLRKSCTQIELLPWSDGRPVGDQRLGAAALAGEPTR